MAPLSYIPHQYRKDRFCLVFCVKRTSENNFLYSSQTRRRSLHDHGPFQFLGLKPILENVIANIADPKRIQKEKGMKITHKNDR